jgi:hypothetical protein
MHVTDNVIHPISHVYVCLGRDVCQNDALVIEVGITKNIYDVALNRLEKYVNFTSYSIGGKSHFNCYLRIKAPDSKVRSEDMMKHLVDICESNELTTHDIAYCGGKRGNTTNTGHRKSISHKNIECTLHQWFSGGIGTSNDSRVDVIQVYEMCRSYLETINSYTNSLNDPCVKSKFSTFTVCQSM